jgi:hypothetical protein
VVVLSARNGSNTNVLKSKQLNAVAMRSITSAGRNLVYPRITRYGVAWRSDANPFDLSDMCCKASRSVIATNGRVMVMTRNIDDVVNGLHQVWLGEPKFAAGTAPTSSEMVLSNQALFSSDLCIKYRSWSRYCCALFSSIGLSDDKQAKRSRL